MITQGKADQRFPLTWEFPDGRIEKGEGNVSCIKREIKEELGVNIIAVKHFTTRRFKMGGTRILIHYYLCKTKSHRFRRLDVKDFKWVNPKRYDEYKLLPPDDATLRKFIRERLAC